jgi:hypothetical protein
VRWSAAARGAPHADARRGLSRPAILPPSLPTGDVVIHDALADEAANYVRHDEVFSGGVERAHDLGLSLVLKGSVLAVDRLPERACPAVRAQASANRSVSGELQVHVDPVRLRSELVLPGLAGAHQPRRD